MKHILDRKSYLKEALWKGVIDRSKTDEDRTEDALGHHQFTDANGKFHRNGILVDSNDVVGDIVKVIKRYAGKQDVIDLNILDFSEVRRVNERLFKDIYDALKFDDEFMSLGIKPDELGLDTSGWDLTSLYNLGHILTNVTHDIGADGWKVNEECASQCTAFKFSYYDYHNPKWYKFDIKQWVQSCCNSTQLHTADARFQEYGIDEARTKQEGKDCYYVIFNTDCTINFIPDNVTIRTITSKKTKRDEKNIYVDVDISGLKTLKNFAQSFDPKERVILHIDLNNFEDNEFIVPDGTNIIKVPKESPIDKLPKELNCSFSISTPKHLNHFTKIDGDLFFRSKYMNSLQGCPDVVTGKFYVWSAPLKDFNGCPKEIGGDFIISSVDKLQSFNGCPAKVGGNIDLYDVKIPSFDGLPECNSIILYNSSFTDFTGFPEKVNGDLVIKDCYIDTINGFPKEIGGKLKISHDTKLDGKNMTLKGILGKVKLSSMNVTYKDHYTILG